jgi:hypothetical protein
MVDILAYRPYTYTALMIINAVWRSLFEPAAESIHRPSIEAFRGS